MVSKYLLLCCLTMLHPLPASSSVTCRSNWECNSDVIQCGVCVDTPEGGSEGQCLALFNKFLNIHGRRDCRASKFCEDCHGHGTCRPFNPVQKLIESCSCTDGYYGWNCDTETPQEYRRLVYSQMMLNFQSYIEPFKEYEWTMNLLCSVEGDSSQGYIVAEPQDGGAYLKFPIDRKPCQKKDIGKFHPYSFSATLPYKPFSNEEIDEVLVLNGNVQGYSSSYNITLNVGGLDNYLQVNLPFFVKYDKSSLVCVPVIQLTGCASSQANEVVYTRSNRIEIRSKVYFLKNGLYVKHSTPENCATDITYKWIVWRDLGYHSEQPLDPIFRLKELRYTDFSLDISVYKVRLEVINVVKNSRNFQYCYFKIKYQPLVAIIDGGSDRKVFRDSGIVLSSTRSHDPNMPPDQQGHVKATWTCVNLADPSKDLCDRNRALPVHNEFTILPERLAFNAVYQITLLVFTDHYQRCASCGSISPALATAKVTVADESERNEGDIYIQCFLNCKEKVANDQRLFLRVRTELGCRGEGFNWTYHLSHETIEAEIPSDKIVEGLPSCMLLMKENSLDKGKSYVIIVRHKTKNLFAKYSFDTYHVEFEGTCSIDPNNGIKGLSLFDVSCYNFFTSVGSFIFEFYDKPGNDSQSGKIFSGRMLGASETGELREFRVTRGQVWVYIKHDSGLHAYQQLDVTLSTPVVTEEVVDELFRNLTESTTEYNGQQVLEYISSLTDILPAELKTLKTLERLIIIVKNVAIFSVSDAKMSTSTLFNIMTSMNDPIQLALGPELIRDVLNIIKMQTELFSLIVGIGLDLEGMTSDEIKDVSACHLETLHITLESADPAETGIGEFDHDLITLDRFTMNSNLIEDLIGLIMDTLTFIQAPGLFPVKITTKDSFFAISVLKNDKDFNVTNHMKDDEDLPVTVPDHFLYEFRDSSSKHQEDITLRVARMDKNVFWWRRSDVKSNLIAVSLAKKTKTFRLTSVKYTKNPLQIQILLNSGLKSTRISDLTHPIFNARGCSFEADQAIKLHRLDPAPLSLVSLTFIYPETESSLLVHVRKTLRPDCEFMKGGDSVLINESSPNYPPIFVGDVEPTFYYIGILSAGESAAPILSYTFEVNTILCQRWEEGYWTSRGCNISSLQTWKDNLTSCECDHFSVFAAAFPDPLENVESFTETTFFLDVFDNIVVVALVLVIIVIFLIACMWASSKDQSDQELMNIIVLEDNFPGDMNAYLVAVCTGSRLNAGTTANVGIKLIGNEAISRAHILRSDERKTLQRNYDDWFLIYSSEPLGDITNIHLWHDNTGAKPDWFCYKIIVYDIKSGMQTVFVVEQWLALRHNYYPEVTVANATMAQVNDMKMILVDNCVLGLRESHTLMAIVFRHPRSEISRKIRVAILTCLVMVAMLFSIYFYSPIIDNSYYTLGMRDFYIIVFGVVLCSVVTFLLLLTFRNSYKYTILRSQSTLQVRASSREEEDKRMIKFQQSLYGKFARFVMRIFQRYELVPAQLPDSPTAIVKKTAMFLLGCVACFTIIITSSVIVTLFGLKLGTVKLAIWLTVVALIVAGDFFIVEPLKVLAGAIALSLVYENMYERETFRLTNRGALRHRVPCELEHLDKLTEMRRQAMYKPLNRDEVDRMLKAKEFWSKLRRLIDLVISVCFVLVVSMIALELWTTHYYPNYQVGTLITEAHSSSLGYQDFFTITQKHQLEKYLENTLVSSLYVAFWYNERPINYESVERDYWSKDFIHRHVGLERLRQVRVFSVLCRARVMNTTLRCVPPWRSDSEDTRDYGQGWRPVQWYDWRLNNSAWKYTKSSATPGYRLYGQSRTLYHDGGYTTHLWPLKTTTVSRIELLAKERWQDKRTAAVFVEFTLYNVNDDLFSQVTLIVEYLVSGNTQLKAQVTSVPGSIQPSVWNILLVLSILYFVSLSGYRINRQGLLEFLSANVNRALVLLILLAFLSVVLALVHHSSSSACYRDFVQRGQYEFFDFDKFVFYFLLLQKFLTLLLVVAILRSVLIFRGGKTLQFFLLALKLSTTFTLWVLFLILWVTLVQTYLMTVVLMPSVHSKELVVVNLNSIKHLVSDNTESGLKVFFFIKTSLVIILAYLFMVIFVYHLKVARAEILRKSRKRNLVTSFFEWLWTKEKEKAKIAKERDDVWYSKWIK